MKKIELLQAFKFNIKFEDIEGSPVTSDILNIHCLSVSIPIIDSGFIELGFVESSEIPIKKFINWIKENNKIIKIVISDLDNSYKPVIDYNINEISLLKFDIITEFIPSSFLDYKSNSFETVYKKHNTNVRDSCKYSPIAYTVLFKYKNFTENLNPTSENKIINTIDLKDINFLPDYFNNLEFLYTKSIVRFWRRDPKTLTDEDNISAYYFDAINLSNLRDILIKWYSIDNKKVVNEIEKFLTGDYFQAVVDDMYSGNWKNFIQLDRGKNNERS